MMLGVEFAIISPENLQKQSKFRKCHLTTTLLLKLRDNIKNAMKNGEVTIAIFADFSKAFYTVDY